jgi:hypothetical protein
MNSLSSALRRIISPIAMRWRTSRTRPSTGMPIARATMTTCAVSEPSSSMTPFNRRLSYSSSSAGPRLRAIRMVSCRRPSLRGRAQLPRNDAQQAVRQILQIVHPVRSRDRQSAHPHPGALLHALDRGFGGQAAVDRLVDAARPAFVIGEHLVGREDLVMLARRRIRPGSHRSICSRILSKAE